MLLSVHVETCYSCRFNIVFFKDVQQKLELYRAHQVRVASQQNAIYKIEEEMKQECLEISSKQTLVIDWKKLVSNRN